jgi:predicted nuclease of predicted toxin-antitoxin system
MSPTRRTPKPKLLLDEGFPPRKSFSMLNQYCDVKHISHDLGLNGATDEAVYDTANIQARIMITFNIKHFKPMITPDNMTVIGISAGLSNHKIDSKLTSLIKSLKPAEWKGAYKTITGDTK